MKRINIESYVMWEIEDLFRPSKRDAIRSELSRENMSTIKKLCMSSEDDFKDLSFVDDAILAKVKKFLSKHGLKFSMTQKEIDDYMDADYLEKHPEEAESNEADTSHEEVSDNDTPSASEMLRRKTEEISDAVIVPIFEDYEEANDIGGQSKMPHDDEKEESNGLIVNNIDSVHYKQHQTPTDGSESTSILVPLSEQIESALKRAGVMERSKIKWDENAVRAKVVEKLAHTSVFNYKESEVEWMRMRFVQSAYNNLPWYCCLFSQKWCARRALKDGTALFETFAKDMQERIVAHERDIVMRKNQAIVEFNQQTCAKRKEITEAVKTKYYKEHPKRVNGSEAILWSDDTLDSSEFKAVLLRGAMRGKRPTVSSVMVTDEL